MVDEDKQEFATLFYGAGEYYNKQVSKELLLIYFNSLRDYSIEDVKSSVSKHMLDSEHGNFFPKLADIVRNSVFTPLKTDEIAELAWAQIRRFLRTGGVYGTLKLDDGQAIAALKSFTTWKEFCYMNDSSMTWAKKEFMSMYSTYEKTPLDMLPSSLPGLIELQNHKKEKSERMAYLNDGIKNYRAKDNQNKE